MITKREEQRVVRRNPNDLDVDDWENQEWEEVFYRGRRTLDGKRYDYEPGLRAGYGHTT